MINTELERLIGDECSFSMTEDQKQAVTAISDFLCSSVNEGVFLLNGYAGTGKTSLVSALVRVLVRLRQNVVLLAPTGRAAKVFALNSDYKALTIHKKIYRQKTFSESLSNFSLNNNLHKHTLFIVDEASMISDSLDGDMSFGSGSLLDDLIHYVYAGESCRLMMVGDVAQLPPVGGGFSPALVPDRLKKYGLKVWYSSLKTVVRQQQMSGILWNATVLRQMVLSDSYMVFPRVRFMGFPDVKRVSGDELIEQLEDSYSKCGFDQTVVITRSNKRANIYNNGIRNRILYREEELCSGDQLLVVKNNYYWASQQKVEAFEFIANGDVAEVRRVRRERQLYGFRFADVLLRFPDYEDEEIEVTVLLNTLQSETPALTREQHEKLFSEVEQDYADITVRRERMKKMKQDSYLNALQVKYAYALTCHKAQGGQWSHVFVDQGYLTEDMLTPDYYRWLYTAFTRASECLFLVNWPDKQTDNTVNME